jgi:transcriptional antiterminator RfaH
LFVVDANFAHDASLRLLRLQVQIPALSGFDAQGADMNAPDELPLNALGQWYVVHTKPRQEVRAQENLARQGYDCFMPMMAVQKIRRGKWVEDAECLFRRYLFIRLVAGQSNFAPIRSTRGVSGLVHFGTQPAVVPDTVVEALRTLPTPEQPMFKAGDMVTITEGAFAGIAAEFVALRQMPDGEIRALVLLELLSKLQKIAVPAAVLRLED